MDKQVWLVFEEYARARTKALIEKGELPFIVGGFIDVVGDAETINCSKCGTPVFLRPWLAEIARQYKLRVECLCCADPEEVKEQVTFDLAKIQELLDA